jgi:hypothetical protein
MASDFEKRLASYQRLRASSTVEEPHRRFTQLVYASEAMVNAGNGFCNVVPVIPRAAETAGLN